MGDVLLLWSLCLFLFLLLKISLISFLFGICTIKFDSWFQYFYGFFLYRLLLSTKFTRNSELGLNSYSAMDFKGITWAGNIYQKFEAMCLEMEEVMYQDSVKYVENQVQKVGVSVKKFYSEVMQDMLPPSTVDPVKVAAGDLPLNPYAHADINKKPKSFLLDRPRELKKIKTEDEAISELISEKLSRLAGNDVSNFSLSDSGVAVQNPLSESCSTKNNKLGVYKRPIGIKRIRRLDRPVKTSNPTTSLSVHLSGKVDLCDARGSCAEASGDISVASSSGLVERHDLGASTISSSVLEAPIKSPTSHKIVSADSTRRMKDKSEHPASLGASAINTSSSGAGSSTTAIASSLESMGEIVTQSDEGKPVKCDSSLDTRNNSCDVEFVLKEAVMSDDDILDLEVLENQEVDEPIIEFPETFERSNLGETCVLVEDDYVDFVLPGGKKHKSYKKKLREALSSKLRPAWKQGSTGICGKDNTGMPTPVLSIESSTKITTSHDPLESEWELL